MLFVDFFIKEHQSSIGSAENDVPKWLRRAFFSDYSIQNAVHLLAAPRRSSVRAAGIALQNQRVLLYCRQREKSFTGARLGAALPVGERLQQRAAL